MEKKKIILTIIIPTFNRSIILNENLKQLSQLYHVYPFNLIVCDNGSTDDTNIVANSWKKKIPSLTIVTHKSNVQFDRNVASGYERVATDYCWVLGDSYYIGESDFLSLINILENKKPQAVIINDASNALSSEERIYTDCNILLHDLGWYTTLLCSCIIAKDFLKSHIIERYYDTYFEHEGVFYEYLSYQTEIYVLVSPSIHVSVIKIGDRMQYSWRKTPFGVFGKGWFSFIMSLPYKYTLDNKLYCIKQHDRKRHIFAPLTMLNLKMSGYCTFEDYKDARPVLKYVLNTPLLFFDIIRYIPKLPIIQKILYHLFK